MAVEVIERPDHIYEAPGGLLLPGISSRLRLSGVAYEFADNAFRDPTKGRKIHEGIHYALEGDLDESSLEPEELCFVNSAIRFVEEEKIEVLRAEYPIGNPDLGYATRIDLYCRWRGRLTVVNWKTGPVYRAYAIQSALEALIFSPEPHVRLGVHLSADSLPRLVNYTDPRDYSVAKAALTLAGWIEKGN